MEKFMKKMFAILAVTILSTSTFASPIPATKLSSYKEAVKLALANVRLSCAFKPATVRWSDNQTDIEALKGFIDQATSGELNESASQPVLIFGYSSFNIWSIAITTSADYKSIAAIDFSQYTPSAQQVNAGTLVNPNIVTQVAHLNPISASCK
jgi:hypothetical protein